MLTSLLDSKSLEMLELELNLGIEAARSGVDDVPDAVCAEFLHDAK